MFGPKLRSEIYTLVGLHAKDIDELKRKSADNTQLQFSIEKIALQIAHMAQDIEEVKKDLKHHAIIKNRLILVIVVLWLSFFGLKSSGRVAELLIPAYCKTGPQAESL